MRSSLELIEATRQVGLLTRLGLPLAEGLREMGRESPLLADLGEDVARGDSLAAAVGRRPQVFSRFYASVVEAAEGSEQPARLLEELSGWLERVDTVRRRVRSAMLYPLLVVDFLLLELLVYCAVVLPLALLPLAEVMAEPDGLPETLVLLVRSDVLVAVPLALLVVLNLAALREAPLSARFSAALPWAGPLRTLAEQALWARATSLLLAAGHPLDRALEEAAPVVRLPALRARLAALAGEVSRGATLSSALAEVPGLDPSLAWSAAAGESREELAGLMSDAADLLDQEVDCRAEYALRMIEPWALLAVGLLVLLGVVAFWAPYYTMVGRIP